MEIFSFKQPFFFFLNSINVKMIHLSTFKFSFLINFATVDIFVIYQVFSLYFFINVIFCLIWKHFWSAAFPFRSAGFLKTPIPDVRPIFSGYATRWVFCCCVSRGSGTPVLCFDLSTKGLWPFLWKLVGLSSVATVLFCLNLAGSSCFIFGLPLLLFVTLWCYCWF